jgi:hypothetical protein
MAIYRGFFVWGGGIVLVLGLFLIFVAVGWPGSPDSCLHLADRGANTCYCEAYNPQDVIMHHGGVRQPVNTWFNLYAIFTSLLVACVLYADRVSGDTRNVMRSMSWIPDVYIFAVLFLGLGSMWFHASLSSATSWVDGFSMYVFASFLVFYTLVRLSGSELVFWIGYPIAVLVFSLIGALWKWDLASLILILVLVAAYLTFEIIICARKGTFMQGTPLTITLWVSGVVAILLATLFWTLSQTGGLLCNPQSLFQPHGMLWHPLAGVTAVLLYFYWRAETASP